MSYLLHVLYSEQSYKSHFKRLILPGFGTSLKNMVFKKRTPTKIYLSMGFVTNEVRLILVLRCACAVP